MQLTAGFSCPPVLACQSTQFNSGVLPTIHCFLPRPGIISGITVFDNLSQGECLDVFGLTINVCEFQLFIFYIETGFKHWTFIGAWDLQQFCCTKRYLRNENFNVLLNMTWASISQLLRLLQKPEIFQSGQNIGIFWLSGSINQVSALLGSRDPKSLHLLSRIWGASLWIRNSNQARNTTQHSRREKQLTLPQPLWKLQLLLWIWFFINFLDNSSHRQLHGKQIMQRDTRLNVPGGMVYERRTQAA